MKTIPDILEFDKCEKCGEYDFLDVHTCGKPVTKQLTLTEDQLVKIGFKKVIIPAMLDAENDNCVCSPGYIRYEIECLNGCFLYSLDEPVYRWYQQIKIGDSYNSIHLNIRYKFTLYLVLRTFGVNFLHSHII